MALNTDINFKISPICTMLLASLMSMKAKCSFSLHKDLSYLIKMLFLYTEYKFVLQSCLAFDIGLPFLDY